VGRKVRAPLIHMVRFTDGKVVTTKCGAKLDFRKDKAQWSVWWADPTCPACSKVYQPESEIEWEDA
jgi:hypothetical protein